MKTMNKNEFQRHYHKHNYQRILLEILWFSRKTFEIVSKPTDYSKEDKTVKLMLKDIKEARKRIPVPEKQTKTKKGKTKHANK